MHEAQLQALGQPVENKGPALLQTLTKFSTSYCQKIEGNSRDIETNQLSGGARICYIFHHTFAATLNAIEPLNTTARLHYCHPGHRQPADGLTHLANPTVYGHLHNDITDEIKRNIYLMLEHR